MAISFLLISKLAIMSMALGQGASRGLLGAGAEALVARAGKKRGVKLDAMCPRSGTHVRYGLQNGGWGEGWPRNFDVVD